MLAKPRVAILRGFVFVPCFFFIWFEGMQERKCAKNLQLLDSGNLSMLNEYYRE
jgi:hypothetical protein